jgi:nitronate monooxygenase
MATATNLTARLQIAHPIIQAPMAGGGDTPELVAAVSEAGGLGFIGAAYLTPPQIIETARAVRARTSRPFGINLFAPSPAPGHPKNVELALERVAPFFAELGLPAPTISASAGIPFAEQLAAVLETDATIFSFTFGLIPPDAVAAVKARKVLLMGTATTVAEAVTLENSGVDAVIAQGSEAGGHRGTFAGDFNSAMIGTMSLVPQIVDAVKIPVVASGGIMDGRGIAAALALGAGAVQMGTAFLTCDEAGVPEAYKQAILNAREDQTRLTRAFSGRPARGIVNRFMMEVEPTFESAVVQSTAAKSSVPSNEAANAILPFPLQNALTRPLRSAAAKQGRAEFLSLWAGQGIRMARRQPAAELVARLANETKAAVARLAGCQ